MMNWLTVLQTALLPYLPAFKYLVYWLTISTALFVITFVVFVAVMKMREIEDTIYQLHGSVRWVCFLILFIGLIVDTLLNWIVLTVSFYELPFASITLNGWRKLPSITFRLEFLSTARVVRHKHHSEGFRKIQANWWCKNWLTPFDKRHCDE